MDKIMNLIKTFSDERDWTKFYTTENLAKSICIESGELLECFQWDNEFDKQKVCDELADVMIYCLHMANRLEVDVEEIMISKMKKNEIKYPIDKAKGNSKKYTEF